MKVGLQIPDFSTPGGPEARRQRPRDGGEDRGRRRVRVHRGDGPLLSDPGGRGRPSGRGLEGYTTLGYLAACTSRAALVTLVTGTIYREPAILAKVVTTLDVLSRGRAWLGIGAAWNEEESRGLGIPFPPTAERFERLEETLQICLQMWRGDERPYQGRYYHLERPLNSPQALSRPHPPIMIGGRRGEEDAAHGGAVRRRVQPVRWPPHAALQAGHPAPALRGGRPRPTTRSTRRPTTGSTCRRARSGSWTTSGRWPGSASTP